MSRGRPNEQVEKLSKWVLNSKDVTYYYDKNKSENGCWKVVNNDTTRYPKPKIDQRTYGKHPVVMVFKTSNRSNAKTKIKVFNKNIDYILTAKKLPGVPEKAEIIELAVGESFIDKFKKNYNLI